MRLARECGAKVLAVTNVMGSQATRDADGVLFTRAGLEVGVAATKTFLAQVAAMYLFGLKLAQVRGALEPEVMERLIEDLRSMPSALSRVLDTVDEPMRAAAEQFKDAGFFLFLGRHIGLPVALEGALKMKEISYIPTDAYAAGGDEARPDRAARREHAGGLRGHRLAGARQDALERVRGARPRGARDRGGHRGRRAGGRERRAGGVRAVHRLAAAAAAGGRAAAAAGLPRGSRRAA